MLSCIMPFYDRIHTPGLAGAGRAQPCGFAARYAERLGLSARGAGADCRLLQSAIPKGLEIDITRNADTEPRVCASPRMQLLSAGWLAQGETLRRWHQRASIDRVAERCSAPACQGFLDYSAQAVANKIVSVCGIK